MKILNLTTKPCQELANAVAKLQAEQSEIVERYERLGVKPSGADAQRLRTLASEIAAAQQKLRQCLEAHPPPPPGPPLKTTFTGLVRLRIKSDNTPDPFNVALTMGATFADGTATRVVTVTAFPPIAVPIDTPLGQDILTISRDSGGLGVFIPADGSLFLDIKLLFDHSLNIITDSHLPLHLTTGSIVSPIQNQVISGSPLAANGQIGLVASSTFVDVGNSGVSVLGGCPATAEVRGTFNPSP